MKTLTRIIIAYLFSSIIAGGIFFSLSVNLFRVHMNLPIYERIYTVLSVSIMMGAIAAFYAAVPSLIVIFIAERRRWNGIAEHLAIGALIGMTCVGVVSGFGADFFGRGGLLSAFSGCVGGAVYWLLTGRKAGTFQT